MDKIAVLIPCYNEEKTIGKVVRDAKAVLPEATVYVYNNNSKDRTAEIAKEAGAVVRNEYMQGKGNVIRRMFREIDALVYIMVDGDDTYPMDAAPKMVDLVLNRNVDMVVGDRLSSTYYQENKRPFHNLGNNVVRDSINRIFDCDIIFAGCSKRLVEGECDILVCTTIIETGVDVANCNTLIVEDADNLGLAQLYQIRGRVGRSSRRAYAWFMFRKDKILTEVSSKRLAAIRDFTSFGSGFKIAMRDLQIRGAGSVLSARQSGHIQNVGYDTYIRILEQAVRDEQGLPAPETEKECKIDLQISAYIPESYIPDNENRIEMYKRIADITCKADYDEVVEELRDRFGVLPECVRLLCSVSSARSNAARLGIYEIRQQKDSVLLYCDCLTNEQIKRAVGELPGRVYYAARGKKYLAISLLNDENPLEPIFKILDVLRETAIEEKGNA